MSAQARGEHQGSGESWRLAQAAVVDVFTVALGYGDVREVQPVSRLTRAEQLAVSGLIVMADWIASDQRHFPGIDSLEEVSLENSRERAAAAWRKLRLRGGWGRLVAPEGEVVRTRFGEDARPSQRLVESVAREMGAPGLMVVEAPMGEGKTMAALAAAEILAARFGADGLFVGMPTQATCDPMFSAVREWVGSIRADLPDQVALLHGKRRFNPEWKALWEEKNDPGHDFAGIYEDEDPFGCDDGGALTDPLGPSEWFLGRYRGLLSGLVVGTIDQLLFAATRTKHVMLRFAGLAGKVVVIDEVHAADIYMEQFLDEALWWLGRASVPVVLLSATIAPEQRRRLVGAYVAGARGVAKDEVHDVPEPTGYPSVTAAWVQDDRARYVVPDAPAWSLLQRGPTRVAVEVLQDCGDDVERVVDRVRREVVDGGIALVIHNTVERAQNTYQALTKYFADDLELLHGRLCASARADRTQSCLDRLGRTGERPARLVVVATQVAEQSFDIDADVLITDIAPVDLLLQRVGRIHRHVRPGRTGVPRVVVAGVEYTADELRLHRNSAAIYGEHRLVRTAALLRKAEATGWELPAAIPRLVARVYGEKPVAPPGWHDIASRAEAAWAEKQQRRAQMAQQFILTTAYTRAGDTLAGLHDRTHRGGGDDDLAVLVRDGEPTIEAIVIRRGPGRYLALDGTYLGANGEASSDVLDAVLAGSVRLPTKLTEAAENELVPLHGWRSNPWLRHTPALVLEENMSRTLGGHRVEYCDTLGLRVHAIT